MDTLHSKPSLAAQRWQAATAWWLSAIVLFGVIDLAAAQTADFQIVWVVVGEAEANPGNQPTRAGRHLFMAPDLMSLSLKNVKVARLDVSPAVSQIQVGQRLCVSSLNAVGYDQDGAALKSAPMSISVRQDQKQRLALTRGKDDICVAPTDAGEYPIRFSSLIPAPDGTTRGAQIFLRVGAAASAVIDGRPGNAMSLSAAPRALVPQLPPR